MEKDTIQLKMIWSTFEQKEPSVVVGDYNFEGLSQNNKERFIKLAIRKLLDLLIIPPTPL
jgi:hypothetical protein